MGRSYRIEVGGAPMFPPTRDAFNRATQRMTMNQWSFEDTFDRYG
jgi:hypothetical protein